MVHCVYKIVRQIAANKQLIICHECCHGTAAILW